MALLNDQQYDEFETLCGRLTVGAAAALDALGNDPAYKLRVLRKADANQLPIGRASFFRSDIERADAEIIKDDRPYPCGTPEDE